MALTPRQRAAQRSLVGLVRTGAQVDSALGLRVWRARGSEEWSVSAEEITEHLDALEIPYTVAVVRRVILGRRVSGLEVRVDWRDLEAFARWVPSVRVLMNAVSNATPTDA